MVKTSEILLELPKRPAVLVEERTGGARMKVRGLFWLTFATVVLGLVVVLASLWKTFATPGVHAPSTTALVPTPVSPTSAFTPVPAASDAPAEVHVAAPAVEEEVAPEPEVVAVPPPPRGFPSLNQFP